MITDEFKVEGMSCAACVGHVTRALTALEGVSKATVSLENRRASVEYDPAMVAPEDLIAAVEEEGYELKRSET